MSDLLILLLCLLTFWEFPGYFLGFFSGSPGYYSNSTLIVKILSYNTSFNRKQSGVNVYLRLSTFMYVHILGFNVTSSSIYRSTIVVQIVLADGLTFICVKSLTAI